MLDANNANNANVSSGRWYIYIIFIYLFNILYKGAYIA